MVVGAESEVTEFLPSLLRNKEMAIIKDDFFPTPYHEYAVLGIYVALCSIYMVFGIHSSSKILKMLLKCAPVLFLITFFIHAASKVELDPMQGVEDAANLERIIFGLIFSCVGDCYLVFDSLFILGILAFTATQLIYIGLFGGGILLFSMPNQNELIIAAAIALVSTLVFLSILPKLNCVLILPVAIYCSIISIMLWCAIVTMQQSIELSTSQGAVGACLFYTSDLLLGVNRWKLQIPCGSYLIMFTYYAAQILIFLSVINTL